MHRLLLIVTAAALCLAAATAAPALAGRFDDKPALKSMLTEMRSQLDLNEEGVDDPEGGGKKEALDAVVDLRGSQRRARREIEKLLDDDQRLKFEQ